MTINRRSFFGFFGLGALMPVIAVAAQTDDDFRIFQVEWYRNFVDEYTLILAHNDDRHTIITGEKSYEFEGRKGDSVVAYVKVDGVYRSCLIKSFDRAGNLKDFWGMKG